MQYKSVLSTPTQRYLPAALVQGTISDCFSILKKPLILMKGEEKLEQFWCKLDEIHKKVEF